MIQLKLARRAACFMLFQRPKRFIALLHRSMSEINRV